MTHVTPKKLLYDHQKIPVIGLFIMLILFGIYVLHFPPGHYYVRDGNVVGNVIPSNGNAIPSNGNAIPSNGNAIPSIGNANTLAQDQLQEQKLLFKKKLKEKKGEINKKLINTIFKNIDPLNNDGLDPEAMPDLTYPHTNIIPEMLKALIINRIEPFIKINFYLECGSFKAGSAVVVAKTMKELNLFETSCVCIDPFTGDVNMWAWQNEGPEKFGHNFLSTKTNGQPGIYEAFVANIIAQGYGDIVLPIRATSIVGMRLLRRLFEEQRIPNLPQMIYLDSAHEKDETLIELQIAWSLLPDYGILWGDDWGWEAVRNDLIRFLGINSLPTQPIDISSNGPIMETTRENRKGVILYKGQWYIQKLP